MFQKIIVKREKILLLILVAIAVFLRLIRLSELFHFTYDESVFAFVGKRMFVNGHLPLIGGVTPFHVHLGPYFYWLSAFFLYLSKLNPLGWGIVSAFLSGITVFLIYLYVSQAYSKKTAFLAVIFYSFSLCTNIFDRHYWGLVFNPLLTMIVIYSLFKITQKRYCFFPILAGALSFGFHTDPSTAIFFPVVFFTFWKYRIPLIKISWAKAGFLIFLLSFLPLVIFDLRHDFVNIKGIFQYKKEIELSAGFSFKRFTDSILLIPALLSRIIMVEGPVDLAKEYSYCLEYTQDKIRNIPFLLLLFSFVILISSMIKKPFRKTEKISLTILNFLLLSSFLGVIVYKGFLGRPFFEHYLSTLIPLLIIFLGLFLDKIITKIKILGIVIISLFIIGNLFQLTKVYHSYGFKTKSEAIKWAIDNTQGDFALESLSNCFKYNGYRYLFYLYGKEPTKSYVDQNFFWLYDSLPSQDHPELLVVFVASDYQENPKLRNLYDIYETRKIKSKQFGEIEVLIVDNTKDIFYEF